MPLPANGSSTMSPSLVNTLIRCSIRRSGFTQMWPPVPKTVDGRGWIGDDAVDGTGVQPPQHIKARALEQRDGVYGGWRRQGALLPQFPKAADCRGFTTNPRECLCGESNPPPRPKPLLTIEPEIASSFENGRMDSISHANRQRRRRVKADWASEHPRPRVRLGRIGEMLGDRSLKLGISC